MLRHAYSMILAIILICQTPLSQADAVCDAHLQTPRGMESIKALIRDSCLGDSNDDAPVSLKVADIRKANPVPGTSKENQYLAIVKMLKAVRTDIAQKSQTMDLPQDVVSPPFNAIDARLAAMLADLNQGRLPTDLDKTLWNVSPSNGTIGGDFYNFKQALLTPACSDSASDQCARATRIAAEMVRYAYLVQQAAQYSSWSDLHDGYLRIGRLLKQWNAYSTETRPQWIHELFINSRCYEQNKEPGLRSPPEHQLIVVHPSVALEYVHGADKGSRFQPALLIEWAGYNRWKWKGDSPQMENAWGASIVSSMSDRAGTTAMGHGFVIHYKHIYSFGMTRHGGDTGFFVSMDVQKFLMNKEEKIQEVIDTFKVLKD